jgi:hypothetical protein
VLVSSPSRPLVAQLSQKVNKAFSQMRSAGVFSLKVSPVWVAAIAATAAVVVVVEVVTPELASGFVCCCRENG